jgi:hypothetical protein
VARCLDGIPGADFMTGFPVPDSSAESDQAPRTLVCARDAHQECPHFAGMGGGGLNPRRLRLEFGTVLCRCSCHDACPLAGTGRWAVPFKLWRDSCTCPGADRARQRMAATGREPPSFREIRERQRQTDQARREAFQAARRAAAGKSRDEIRELYLAELRARGLPPPPEQALAATVEHIAGNPIPAARLAVHGFAQLGKGAVALARLLRDINRPPR